MQRKNEWWKVQWWSKKPEQGARFEHAITVWDYNQIKNFSFLRNLKTGWYTTTWFKRIRGRYAPHRIESSYHLKKDVKTGKIIAEHWRGTFGNWKYVKSRKEIR